MKIVGISDKGQKRSMNQDSIFYSPTRIGKLPNVLALADGMGGEKAGDLASRLLISELVEAIQTIKGNLSEMTLLRRAIEQANMSVYFESKSSPDFEGMGSTLVAACIRNNKLIVANVGDSRLYLFRDWTLRQITKDHSYAEEMVARGKYEKGSKEYLEDKRILTRAIGTSLNVEIDVFEEKLMDGDVILLCSDGLTNMISEEDIIATFRRTKSLEGAVKSLVRKANTAGGYDNISVILAIHEESEANV